MKRGHTASIKRQLKIPVEKKKKENSSGINIMVEIKKSVDELNSRTDSAKELED